MHLEIISQSARDTDILHGEITQGERKKEDKSTFEKEEEGRERERESDSLLVSSIKRYRHLFSIASHSHKRRRHTGSTPSVCKPGLTAPVNSGKYTHIAV